MDFLLIILLLILLYLILKQLHIAFFKDYSEEDIKIFLNKFSDVFFISILIAIFLSILLRVFNFNLEGFNSGVFLLSLLFFASVSFLYDVFVLAYKKELHPKTSTGVQWVDKKYMQSMGMGIKISIVRALSALLISFVIYFLFSVVVSVVATYIFLSLAFFLVVIKVYYFWENHKKTNFIAAFGAGIIPSPYIFPIALFFVLGGHFWSAIIISFVGSLVLEFIAIKKAVAINRAKLQKAKKKQPTMLDKVASNFPKLNHYFLYFLLTYCISYLVYILYTESETLLMILYRIH